MVSKESQQQSTRSMSECYCSCQMGTLILSHAMEWRNPFKQELTRISTIWTISSTKEITKATFFDIKSKRESNKIFAHVEVCELMIYWQRPATLNHRGCLNAHTKPVEFLQ